MKKHRRWILSAIETSKTVNVTMPWQQETKLRPVAFRHLQMQVPPKYKAIAAR